MKADVIDIARYSLALVTNARKRLGRKQRFACVTGNLKPVANIVICFRD
jgi:hypothetical protein